MAACTVTFDTGNAAFDGGNGPAEAAGILRRVAEKLEAGHEGGSIHDSNGNRIGSWSVEYPDEE